MGRGDWSLDRKVYHKRSWFCPNMCPEWKGGGNEDHGLCRDWKAEYPSFCFNSHFTVGSESNTPHWFCPKMCPVFEGGGSKDHGQCQEWKSHDSKWCWRGDWSLDRK